jgi:dihydrodipicolinate synthase/N-acetylneuraminate lyase
MTARRTAALRGILVAVTTPFTPDGSAVDDATLRSQTDRLVAAGIHGIVCTGTTGEFTTLTAEEYRHVITTYVDAAAGRIPVVAGVGALATSDAIALAQHAEASGADAIMLLPPFYGGQPWEQLLAFVRDVAGSISIPVVYYNVPSATGTVLSAEQLAQLGDVPGLDYMKDTSGNAVALGELLVKHTDRITAFNGWDTLTFFGIASGAQGSVWGMAGIVPQLAVQLWEVLAEKGDLATARELWKPLWALSDFLESVDYVAGVKAALELVGHPAGPARLPIQPLAAGDRERLAGILSAAGALSPAQNG